MKCLYISYDGLLDPLGQSQILPYIHSLISRGHTFTIISFEKQDRSSESIAALENHLINNGIRWEKLTFKKGNFISRNSIRVRVISSKNDNVKLILKNKNIKNSLKYLNKYSNFLIILINNKKIDNNDNENTTLRYYGIGAQIIKDLNVKNMILVTRSKKKIIGLEGFGLKIKKQEIIK